MQNILDVNLASFLLFFKIVCYKVCNAYKVYTILFPCAKNKTVYKNYHHISDYNNWFYSFTV